MENTYENELYELKLDLFELKRYYLNASKEDKAVLFKQIKQLEARIDQKYFENLDRNDDGFECCHPLWYLIAKDKEYGIESYVCKCLKCGKTSTGGKQRFRNVVAFNALRSFGHSTDENFNRMKIEFDKVYSAEDKVKTRKLMLDKYKVQ